MKEELDNPVWSALTTGNKHLSIGDGKARRFEAGISPFAGIAQNNVAHYHALRDLMHVNETVAIFTTDKNIDVGPLQIVNRIDGYQMTYGGKTPEKQNKFEIKKMTEEHVPAMLELTKLSPPGPFMERTIRFGGYEGIFEGEQLVAMAGRRFHSFNNVEISAVCTHPDHSGKGYARTLMYNQIEQLHKAGNAPYLHVRADNTRAFSLYQTMGFSVRTEMIIYILRSI